MKYSTVQIRKSAYWDTKGKFAATFEHSDLDRVDTKTVPNAGMGFYHYPSNMPRKKAAAKLANAMINLRINHIKQALEDISQLKEFLNESLGG